MPASRSAAQTALPQKHASRRNFERSAATFASASMVHDEARLRLLERLQFVRLGAQTVVDLGCGHAAGARQLDVLFPRACVLGIDVSLGMLRAAGAESAGGRVLFTQADAARLPLPERSVQLLLANLLLPWCEPAAVFAEAARVLAPGGLLLFSTLGPDTLREVRRAWAQADDRIHVHGFFDMHDIGDMAVRAGLQEPVIDVERIEISYRDVTSLVRDLRACGGTNVAAGRRSTLTGPRRWRRFESTLLSRRAAERFAVTAELVFGQAWGPISEKREPPGETVVPIANIGVRH